MIAAAEGAFRLHRRHQRSGLSWAVRRRGRALAVIGGGKIAEGAYDEDEELVAARDRRVHPRPGRRGPGASGRDPARRASPATAPSWSGASCVRTSSAFDPEIAAARRRSGSSATGVTDDEEAVRDRLRQDRRALEVGHPADGRADLGRSSAHHGRMADCLAISLRKPRDSPSAQRLAEFTKMLTGFRYGDDLDGVEVPVWRPHPPRQPARHARPAAERDAGREHAHQPPPHPAPRPALR